MKLNAPFDATKIDPTQVIGNLPVGKHLVVIDSSELKAAKNSAETGSGYLQFILSIVDGPHKGATGQYILNIYNKSEKAVDHANRQLSAICHVTGVFMVSDTTQLHGIPFIVEVASRNDPQNPSYTEIKRVFDASGREPQRGQAPQPSQPAQPPQPAQPQQPQQPPGWTPPTNPGQPPAAPAGWQQPTQPAWGQQAAQQPANGQPTAPAQPSWTQPAQAPAGAAGGPPPWGQR